METKKDQPIKLNPFALPLETDLLFLLLVVAGILLMLGLSMAIAFPSGFVTSTVLANYAGSVVMAANNYVPQAKLEEVVYNFQQVYGRSFPTFYISVLSPIVVTGLVLAIAYLLYRQTSARLIKKKHLERLRRSTDSKLYDMVNHLSAEVGLETPPIAHINNENLSTNSQVWTYTKRNYISFGMGSRTLLRKKANYLKAIILHEFAHILNRDINYTYYVQSLWWVVAVATGLALLVATSLYVYYLVYPEQAIAFFPTRPELSEIGLFVEYLQGTGLSWLQFAGGIVALFLFVIPTFSLSLVILLIRAQLLRLRELYADCRAAGWGVVNELRSILARQPRRKRSMLQNIFALHPAPDVRQNYLDAPHYFFHFPYSTSVITGFLIGFLAFTAILALFAYQNISFTLSQLSAAFDILRYSSNLAPDSFLLGKGTFSVANSLYVVFGFLFLISFLLFVAFLITEVGGIAVQRKLVLNQLRGRTPWQETRELAAYACSFAFGVVLGIALLLLPLMFPGEGSIGYSLRIVLSLILIVFSSVALGVWIVLEYIYRFSRLGFTQYQGCISPQRISRSVRVSALLLMIVMALGLLMPSVIIILRGFTIFYLRFASSSDTVFFEYLQRLVNVFLEEPTRPLGKIPAAVPPELANAFLSSFPSFGEIAAWTVFCLAVLTAIFFVLSQIILGQKIQFVRQCPQCGAGLSNQSWVVQSCSNCGCTSGWWIMPENMDQQKRALGLASLEEAYDLSGRNRNRQALSAGQRALKYLQHKSEALNLLGMIHEKLGQREEANHAFSQALALSPGYEAAKQNLEIITKLPAPEPKRPRLKRYWERTKKSPEAKQSKNEQVKFIFLALLGYLISLVFDDVFTTLWGALWNALADVLGSLIAVGIIAVAFAAVYRLLGKRLSDHAKPGKLLVSLLIVQLLRFAASGLVLGSSFSVLFDVIVIFILIITIMWLIYLPGISAYLSSIVVAIFLLVHLIAVFVIFSSMLPAFSLTWLIDPALLVAIICLSFVGYKQYMTRLANRQTFDFPVNKDLGRSSKASG